LLRSKVVTAVAESPLAAARGTSISKRLRLHRWFGYVAVGLGLAFEVAGIVALFTSVGLILAIILSVAQELWIIAAVVALWRPARGPR
jgi:hypothetical protein